MRVGGEHKRRAAFHITCLQSYSYYLSGNWYAASLQGNSRRYSRSKGWKSYPVRLFDIGDCQRCKQEQILKTKTKTTGSKQKHLEHLTFE